MLTSVLRTVDPTVEPVTLQQAKAQCRVTVSDDDTLIMGLIKAARAYVEQQTGRALIQQTLRASYSHFPRLQQGIAVGSFPFWGGYGFPSGACGWFGPGALILPKPRLIAVTSVHYIDPYGNPQTLDPSLYTVAADGEPATLIPAVGSWWPWVQTHRNDAVQVTYTAGYGAAASAIPNDLQLAILMLVGHWYENREATVLPTTGTGPVEVPVGVDALLASYALPVFTYGGD